jgi:hypothetical protein
VAIFLDAKALESPLPNVFAGMIVVVVTADLRGEQPGRVSAELAAFAWPECEVEMVGHPLPIAGMPAWVYRSRPLVRFFGKGERHMMGGKTNWVRRSVSVVGFFVLISAIHADESPRETINAAIKGHGGEKRLAKTLIGTLVAKAKVMLAPDVEGSISWQETFELPRRYRRSIKGQFMGKDFSMEYAVTNGSGWTRENGGELKEFKGAKMPLSSSWNAILAILPSCLDNGITLGPGGNEKVEGRDAIGVSVSGEVFGGAAVLLFDARSGLLVKSKRRMQHPLSHDLVDGEVAFSDYKEISGVQYPHRITSYIAGKKVIEMEITRIVFLRNVEDNLFAKP